MKSHVGEDDNILEQGKQSIHYKNILKMEFDENFRINW